MSSTNSSQQNVSVHLSKKEAHHPRRPRANEAFTLPTQLRRQEAYYPKEASSHSWWTQVYSQPYQSQEKGSDDANELK